MNKFIIFALGVLVFSSQANAQEMNSNAVCNLLPSGSVANSVVYQPGVDAYGNAVVPAEGPAATDVTGEIVKVPLTVDLAEKVRRMAGMGAELDAQLGMVEIHPNGHVFYNGENWTKPVSALCGKSFKEVTVEVVEPAEIIDSVQPAMIEPAAPAAPVIENPLPNNLAVDEASARVTPPVMREPIIVEPAEPIKPLIGTPKVEAPELDASDIGNSIVKNKKPPIVTKDIIMGQEAKDYNE